MVYKVEDVRSPSPICQQGGGKGIGPLKWAQCGTTNLGFRQRGSGPRITLVVKVNHEVKGSSSYGCYSATVCVLQVKNKRLGRLRLAPCNFIFVSN